MANEFNPLGYKVGTRVIPDFLVKGLGYISKAVRDISPMVGRVRNFSHNIVVVWCSRQVVSKGFPSYRPRKMGAVFIGTLYGS